MHTIGYKVQPPRQKVLVVLLSELADGRYFVTSSQRKQFNSAPNIIINRLIGAPPEKLLKSHLDKLRDFSGTNPPRPVRSPEEFDDLWDRYERNARDFGLQRGIYVWMTPGEVAKESQDMAEVQAVSAAVGGGQHDGVLLELHGLQNKKAGWGGIVGLLVISLLLFIFVGARQWSWNYLFILLGVLFVHETGHYLAMRAFNYRNLRMFFIPFFGAAVSGQNHNVPGWKKVVVSLMGPLPGIVLGIILGVAGMAFHQPWLLKTAIVAILLNGFNLLPVLPMDGGWVLHTLIFCRHPMLDAAFRVMAVVGLIVLGSFTSSKVLMYVGIPMAMGIPRAYRAARIAADLRRRNLPSPAPDEQDIPAETANAIIEEVKKTSGKPEANKIVAQQALQIFETINAHPPGWPATIGLLFTHLCSLALAAVFACVFIFAQRGSLAGLFNGTMIVSKHSYSCGTQSTWHGEKFDAAVNAQPDTIVATFPKHAAAQAQFQALTSQLPPEAGLTLFGDTLLLTLPADDDVIRKRWLDALSAATKDVFVDSTNFRTGFSILAIAPNAAAASNIVLKLNGYLNTLPEQSLIPPWPLPGTGISTADETARETWMDLQEATSLVYTNTEFITLEKRIDKARKNGDRVEAEQLRGEYATLEKKLKAAAVDSIRIGAAGKMTDRMVDLFLQADDPALRTNRVALAAVNLEIAQLMGQIPTNSPVADGRLSARSGGTIRNGLFVQATWVSFNRLDEGSTALATWLCDQGCIGIKYDFQAGGGGYDGGGDD
jgi:Zn-dependent protease